MGRQSVNTVNAVQNVDDPSDPPTPTPTHAALTGMMAWTTIQKGMLGYYIYVLYDH